MTIMILFCAISFGGIGLILGDTFAQVVYLEKNAFIVLIMASLSFAWPMIFLLRNPNHVHKCTFLFINGWKWFYATFCYP